MSALRTSGQMSMFGSLVVAEQLHARSMSTTAAGMPHSPEDGHRRDLSSPGPGRTVLASTEPWAAPFRKAVATLQGGLSGEPIGLIPAAWPTVPGSVDASPALRAAHALGCMWVVGRSFGALPPEADLYDAEVWFTGSDAITKDVTPMALTAAAATLKGTGDAESLGSVLPYVFDLNGPGTRREVIRNPAAAGSRSRRKSGGVYYTPGDVAQFMVESALGRWGTSGLPRTLDPACGTGVFLREMFRQLVRAGYGHLQVLMSLFGVDISATAIDSCAFVLTHDALAAGCNRSPAEVWGTIRSQLTVGDSLTIPKVRASLPFGDDPHRTALPYENFDIVIANPPYAQLGSSLSEAAGRFETLATAASPGTDRFVPFMELMWEATAPNGIACMVIPLSVAYNSQAPFMQLRRCIDRVAGQWSFLFFDRTPDALFGDDVKQRTAIALLDKARPKGVRTSPVNRWTSRNRTSIFSWDRVIPVTSPIDDFIPKLGRAWEAEAYRMLQATTSRFADEWATVSRTAIGDAPGDPSAVLVAGTAYNWLTVVRDARPAQTALSAPSMSPMLRIQLADSTAADFAYGVLCSRLTYWLWRVEGDCFHVQRQFLARLPFSLGFDDQLVAAIAQAGRELWEVLVERPVLSVNGGRETVGYCTYGQEALLDRIDKALVTAFDLPIETVGRLRDYVLKNTVVDSSEAERVASDGRALAAWRM